MKSLVSVSAHGAIDVPVKVKHAKPALFKLTTAHAPSDAVLEKGRFKWKPAGQTGSWRVDFSALDEQGHGVTESMEIQVNREDKGDSTVEVRSPDPVDAVTSKPVKLQLKASARDAGHILFETVHGFGRRPTESRYRGAVLDSTTPPARTVPDAISREKRTRHA